MEEIKAKHDAALAKHKGDLEEIKAKHDAALATAHAAQPQRTRRQRRNPAKGDPSTHELHLAYKAGRQAAQKEAEVSFHEMKEVHKKNIKKWKTQHGQMKRAHGVNKKRDNAERKAAEYAVRESCDQMKATIKALSECLNDRRSALHTLQEEYNKKAKECKDLRKEHAKQCTELHDAHTKRCGVIRRVTRNVLLPPTLEVLAAFYRQSIGLKDYFTKLKLKEELDEKNIMIPLWHDMGMADHQGRIEAAIGNLPVFFTKISHVHNDYRIALLWAYAGDIKQASAMAKRGLEEQNTEENQHGNWNDVVNRLREARVAHAQ